MHLNQFSALSVIGASIVSACLFALMFSECSVLMLVMVVTVLGPGVHMCGRHIFGCLYHSIKFWSTRATCTRVPTCEDREVIVFYQNFK